MSQEQAQPASTSDRSRLRSLIAGFLALLVLASGATLFWLLSQRTGEAADLQRERERAMSVARSFVLRVNTYGPEFLAEDGTMPDYRERVGELITPAFRADFEQQVGTAELTVAQAELGRACEVYGAGVSGMDADSATALVAGAFVNSYPGSGKRADERIETDPAPFRVRVSLVKVSGEWLVDDFTPVTGSGVTLDPTEAPEPGTEPDGSGSEGAGSEGASPEPEPTEDEQ